MRIPVARWIIGTLAALSLLCSACLADLQTLERMVERNPDDIRLLFLLGKEYSRLGMHRRAQRIFQKILKKRRVPVVLLHLGLEFARSGNLTGAILQWTTVLDENPRNVTAMRLMAQALLKQAKENEQPEQRKELYEQSLIWWKRILKLDPFNLKARYYAGIACYQLGYYEKACKHWILLLRKKPRHRRTLCLLAKGLIKCGEYDKAARVARKVLEIEKDSPGSKYHEFASRILARLSRGAYERHPERAREDTSLSRDEVKPPTEPQYDPKTDPEPPKGPRPARMIPRIEPGVKISLKAENLFLDGLDYKDQGKLEQALFAFLQAIDLEPNFLQAYLQLADVYLQLAKLAKLQTQYDERISLALQTLDRLENLSPSSLLWHAAKGKRTLLERMKQWGFKKFHLREAHKAIKEQRFDEAFEEYVLLLSNRYIEEGIFLELGSILPRLTSTARSDLDYFCSDFLRNTPDAVWFEYLKAKLALLQGKKDEARRLLGHFLLKVQVSEKFLKAYSRFCKYPKVHNLDRFVLGKLLHKSSRTEEAKKWLEAFLKHAPKDDPFRQDAMLLLEKKGTAAESEERPAGSNWKREKKALLEELPQYAPLFKTPRAAEETERLLRNFLEAEGKGNAAAALLHALVLQRCLEAGKLPAGMNEAEARREVEDTFSSLLVTHTNDAEWHLKAALLCAAWHQRDQARAHAKFSSQIMTFHGIYENRSTAKHLLSLGIRSRDESTSRLLVELAGYFTRERASTAMARVERTRRKGETPLATLGSIPSVLLELTSDEWNRRLLLCDMGLALATILFLVLLGLSISLTLRHLDELLHIFAEIWEQAGVLLPVGITPMLLLVMLFPAGVILFVPLLLWSMLDEKEKAAYVGVGALMFAAPLLLPATLYYNVPLVESLYEVQVGDPAAAARFFEEHLERQPWNDTDRGVLAYTAITQGRLDEASERLEKIMEHYGEDEATLVNLGVVEARKGNLDESLKLWQKVLSVDARNPGALYDISSTYKLQEREELASRYLRWALSVAGEEKWTIDRLSQLPPSITRLPLYIAKPSIDEYERLFSLYSGFNLLSWSSDVTAFLVWFILGGGLAGFLLYMRLRYEIVPSRCERCRKCLCTICEQTVSGRIYCRECLEQLKSARKEKRNHEEEKNFRLQASRRLRAGKSIRGLLLSLVLPGAGLAAGGRSEWYVPAAFLCWTGFYCWWTLPDTLVALLAAPRTPHFWHDLCWISLAAALLVHLLCVVLTWTAREEWEWNA